MGAGEIDSLEIKIQANAQKANQSLDALVGKLERLSTSLGKVNGNSLSSLSSGVQRLSSSMQSMKNIGTADFTRLAKNIQKMGQLDSKQLGKAAGSIHKFVNALGTIDKINVSDNASRIGQLAKGISQLGYKSSTQAIENIPKLAKAMRQLMTELSKAPKVSQNLIQMTNALAKLSRTGASSGRAANSLTKAFDGFSRSSHTATKKSFSLASAIGKAYATYWMIFRAIGKFRDAIDISSQLTEVQNVVDVTFGNMAYKVEEFAKTSIQQFGMSELSLKQYASRFQAMGSAMGISGSSIGSANDFLSKQTKGYVGASNSMADMSLNLTKLTADMASFYNVEQAVVAEDLEAIFTGQTRPLRQYGLDLTQATLQEWALKNGIDANVQSMSQAEKTMLRYQYVMANTGAAQNDFARTANTWSNQIRILKQNFEQLGSVVGGTLINALKPLVQALNAVMGNLIAFAETVSNALGKIFGWKFEKGSGGAGTAGLATDMEDAADSAGGLADKTGKAAKNIDKMKAGLRAFDELKTISMPDSSSGSGSGSGGSGGASGGGASGGSGGQWTKQDSIFEDYKSSIDSLKGLGEYIRDALIKEVGSIDWESIYKKADNFGKGLAEFLNGLFSEDKNGNSVFTATADVIAGSLNTALHALNSFGETFKWDEFGKGLAKGLKTFFEKWDAKLTGKTFSTFVKGILESITSFIDTLKNDDVWKTIGQKIADFICGVDWKGISFDFTNFWISLKDSILEFPKDFVEGFITGIVDNLFGEEAGEKVEEYIDNFANSKLGKALSEFNIDTIINAIPALKPIDTFTKIVKRLLGISDESDTEGTISLSDVIKNCFNWDETKGFFDEMIENFKAVGDSQDIIDAGAHIFEGIMDGFVAAFGAIVEPFTDFFTWVWNGICDAFGIHSPAKEMKPLGENILLGIIEGWKDKLENFSFKELGEKLIEKIKDGIQKVKDNVLEFKAKIKNDASEWWKNTKEWWGEKVGDVKEFTTGVKDKASEWWKNTKEWWGKKVGKAKEFTTDVKNSASTWWSNTKNYWSGKVGQVQNFITDVKNNASTWWSNAKKYWKEKVGDVQSFTTNLKDTSRKWWSDAKRLWNSVKGTLSIGLSLASNALSNIWTSVKNFFSGKSISIGANATKKADGGAFYNGSWHPVAQYAAGGFPSHGSLFVAGEAGSELVGHIGGRTEVLNQSQLASTMYSSVLSAMETALSKQRGSSQQPIQVYLDGKVVFDNTRQRANEHFRRTGESPFPF